MAEIRVLVSVKDDYIDRLSEVSERLQAKGLQVDQLLPNLGVITGQIDSAKLSVLQVLEGVHQCEEEKPFEAI